MYPCDKLIIKPALYGTKLKNNICSFHYYFVDKGSGVVQERKCIKELEGGFDKKKFKGSILKL